MGRGLLDSRDRAVPAVEHGYVLRHGNLMGGGVQGLEIGVDGPAVGVAELGPRELEVRSQLHQWHHASL